MTDDTACPMPGAQAESGRRRKKLIVVAAAAGALVLVPVVISLPGILHRRRLLLP